MVDLMFTWIYLYQWNPLVHSDLIVYYRFIIVYSFWDIHAQSLRAGSIHLALSSEKLFSFVGVFLFKHESRRRDSWQLSIHISVLLQGSALLLCVSSFINF